MPVRTQNKPVKKPKKRKGSNSIIDLFGGLTEKAAKEKRKHKKRLEDI